MAAWQMAAMLYQMELCKQNPNATCCNDSAVNRNVTFVDCPLPDCEGVIVSHLRQAVNIAGCLGLIFSFTEVCQPHFLILNDSLTMPVSMPLPVY